MKLNLLLAGAALAVPLVLVAANSSSPAAVSAAAATWNIDPVHSSIIFKVKHAGVSSFYGRFNKMSGTIVLNEEKPGDSTVEVTIPVESIDTNNGGRNDHLKSPDFFNAKEFPEITFASTVIKKDGDKRWKLEGEMTMHGVTQPVSAIVEMGGTGEMRGTKIAGFETTFKFKRSDFGMKGMLDMLGDEITVMAGFECTAGK